jgi:hypothetical protein
MANDYLEDGPDAEAKAEISRLLARLVFSNEQLEAMAGIAVAGAGQSGLNAASGTVQDCLEFFKPIKIPPGVDKCLEQKDSHFLNYLYFGTYRVFYPAASLPAAGWKTKHYDLAFTAMEKTLPVFDYIFDDRMNELGKKGPSSVNIVFSVASSPGEAAKTYAKFKDKHCSVVVFKGMQSYSDDDSFKQVIAHELAHCIQEEMFPDQNKVDYAFRKWREEGLAD